MPTADPRQRPVEPAAVLETLGISLPPPTPPVGAFAPCVRAGSVVYVSGHIARRDGQPWTGRVGDTVSADEGHRAARAAAIDVLGTLQGDAGGLSAISRIVKMTVFINCTPEFTDHPSVANGASDLLRQVFGEAGVHARAAVGVAQLPFGACVEIDLVAELATVERS
jgi:enamine deaminase RidA (YjgF/YER057c/UK114 family)